MQRDFVGDLHVQDAILLFSSLLLLRVSKEVHHGSYHFNFSLLVIVIVFFGLTVCIFRGRIITIVKTVITASAACEVGRRTGFHPHIPIWFRNAAKGTKHVPRPLPCWWSWV
jgi:hypothetical protein